MDQLVSYCEQASKRLLTRPRVLVVDDEEVIRSVFRRFLRRAGFMVDVADTAEAGWANIEKGRYDLLLADKNLPGESGIDLLAKIQSSGRPIRSVLMTGYPSAESIVEALNLDACSYITKPLPDIPRVVEMLHSIVEREASCHLYDRMLEYAAENELGGEVEAVFDNHRKFVATLDDATSALVHEDVVDAEGVRDMLLARGTTATVDDAAAAVRQADATGPLVVLVERTTAGCGDFIRRLIEADPLVRVVAVGGAVNQERTLDVVSAGAVDVVCDAALLGRRVGRHAAHGRRRRAAIELFTAWQRAAKEISEELAQRLFVAIPPADRETIKKRSADG